MCDGRTPSSRCQNAPAQCEPDPRQPSQPHHLERRRPGLHGAIPPTRQRRARCCVRIVCPNVAKLHEPVREPVAMAEVDAALLRESECTPPGVASQATPGPETHHESQRWNSRPYEAPYLRQCNCWPTVIRRSERVELEWLKQVGPISKVAEDETTSSSIGTMCRLCRTTDTNGASPRRRRAR